MIFCSDPDLARALISKAAKPNDFAWRPFRRFTKERREA
jgi:hypothetical protein